MYSITLIGGRRPQTPVTVESLAPILLRPIQFRNGPIMVEEYELRAVYGQTRTGTAVYARLRFADPLPVRFDPHRLPA